MEDRGDMAMGKHQSKGGKKVPAYNRLISLYYAPASPFVYKVGIAVAAQPTEDLHPDDTEAIIAAFLSNATEQAERCAGGNSSPRCRPERKEQTGEK